MQASHQKATLKSVLHDIKHTHYATNYLKASPWAHYVFLMLFHFELYDVGISVHVVLYSMWLCD